MAEEMEKAQKALRDMDYDSMSEDGDDEEDGISSKKSTSNMTPSRNVNDVHPAAFLPSPEVSSASKSSLELFLSSADTENNNDYNNYNSERTNNGTVNSQYDNTILIDTSQPSTQMTKSIPENSLLTSHPSVSLSTSPSPSKLFNEIRVQTVQNALIDDDDSIGAFSVELQTFKTDSNQDDMINGYSGSSSAISINNIRTTRSPAYPGTAGFLEMEEEPPREVYETNIGNNTAFGGESIKTDSGLVLTHRKTTNASPYRNKQQDEDQLHQHQDVFRDTQQNYFEVENGVFRGWNKGNPNFRHRKEGGNYFAGSSGGMPGSGNGKHSMVMVQVRRLMSYVKIWVVLFLVVLLAMTGVFFHSMGRQEDYKTSVTKTDTISTNSLSSLQSSSINMNANSNANAIAQSSDTAPDKILLIPLTDTSAQLSSFLQQQQQQRQNYQHLQHNYPRRLQEAVQPKLLGSYVASNGNDNSASSHRFLRDLRQEFEDWVHHHGKAYHSEDEKQLRFSIWSQNHRRTGEKNTRHGPCTLTKQHVFGSNQFKDLAPEEFQAKFLTGYKGEFTDVLEKREQQEWSPGMRRLRKDSGIGMVLNPEIHKVNIHESVVKKQRHLKQSSSRYKPQVMGSSSMHCKWYDLSCVLRYVWQSTGIQFGSLIGTMEPKYDADAFPNSVDWRDSGAVTSIRTQGECGACWAVTAVETVESAYFLATGNLYELSESEIIVCDDSCEMCSGGWPQNAFEWVMDHGGLPLSNTLPYDAYTLIALTAGLEGKSNYYDENTVESYRQSVCPADDDTGSGSGSSDNSYWEDGMENENYADYSNQGRYGNIKGYGYATDRCLCYTDGSGCDCEDQDEDTAVRNIATYGPAVVCLEASTWQDYSGGIMTSDIGCGNEFLDMNHCVQVVGYAFSTSADCNGEEDCNGSEDDGSGSNSNSGSDDSGDREGYWIVRNQWGGNWGMNGYAYVSMGANTCGILNDMTVAYA
jgi:C1A family cysteine protease